MTRRWRFYATRAGRRPVREFLDSCADADAAAIAAGMKDVAVGGLVMSRHLRGDIYEVRVDGDRQSYRVLFAAEGSRGQILSPWRPSRRRASARPHHRSPWRRSAWPTGVPAHAVAEHERPCTTSQL